MRTLVWFERNLIWRARPITEELSMRAVIVASCCLVAAVLGLAAQVRTGTLNIYYIDTEGGQSTLVVGPTGGSLLVDTGHAGERDLGRIVETLRTAGVTTIDHFWITPRPRPI